MKLRYLFSLLIATVALMTSCDDKETETLLDEIQVSSSYVSISKDNGGSATITVTAKDSWTAEKVTTDKNKVEWLTLSTTSGNAGESELTFTAPSSLDGRSAEVLIKSGGKTQRINIIQGLATISAAKVSDVKAGPDAKTFRVSGVCTSISNTEYGNWDITDETGSLYIYGTLDAKGGTKNFLSLGLEVGDEVTVEGPKSTYQGSPQLVNVTVIKISKSLVKVDSVKNAALPIEGGEFTTYLTCKGQGISVEIPEDAKSWLSISSIKSSGTNAVVIFKAAANTGGDRGTTLTFHTTDGSKDYSSETTLSQKGAIVDATVAEFIAAEVGDTQYRLKGVVTEIDAKYNNNLYISDFSGKIYAYRLNLQDKVVKVGDIITVVGKRAAYNGPQMGSGVLENVISVTAATIAEVMTKPDSSSDYYMVTGEITSVTHAEYGRFYFKDGSSNILVYGCNPGYGATGNDRNNLLANKDINIGDSITVIGTKGSYNNVAQLTNSFYFSHKSAE